MCAQLLKMATLTYLFIHIGAIRISRKICVVAGMQNTNKQTKILRKYLKIKRENIEIILTYFARSRREHCYQMQLLAGYLLTFSFFAYYVRVFNSQASFVLNAVIYIEHIYAFQHCKVITQVWYVALDKNTENTSLQKCWLLALEALNQSFLCGVSFQSIFVCKCIFLQYATRSERAHWS